MFKNKIITDSYNTLLENHSEREANYILLNCLAVLGDKKIIVSETLDEKSIERVNRYKYPDRLASFVNKTSNKTTQWSNLSFAKIAFT